MIIRPPKGQWPKSEKKRAALRRLLEAATAYKRANERHLYGKLGRASRVRHIDPQTLTGEERERLGLPRA